MFPMLKNAACRTMVCLALLGTSLGCASAAPREYSFLDTRSVAATLAQVRDGEERIQPAVRALLREADVVLHQEIPPLTIKPALPPSGDPHDYYSLSPYWWPDSTKPDGLPYVRRDGRVNPERETIRDREFLRKVYSSVETLTLAYALSGKEDYAKAAVRILRQWFVNPETRMNPSLTFAQIVRGNKKPRGAGIIEGRGMIILAASLDLLFASPHLTASDRTALTGWLRAYYQWLHESPQGKDEIDAPNNHGSWYDAQRVTIAWTLRDTAGAKRIAEEALTLRIASQIEPDGRQPQELRRTRALHYSTFNLMALFALASVAERVGVDMWTFATPDGRSIRKALDWLAPYATGKSVWPYEQIGEYEPDFFYELLLRAAVVYKDEHYRLLVESMKGIDTRTHRGILLHPEALRTP